MEVQQAGCAVVVASEEPIVRDAVSQIITEGGSAAVYAAASAAGATAAVGQGGVAIIDAALLGSGALGPVAAGLGLRSAALLVLRGSSELDELARLMAGGARGYLCRTATALEILECLSAVQAGRRHVPAVLAGALADRLLDGGPPTAPMLTPREQDVLRLAAAGHTTAAIAGALFVSPSTAKTHLQNAYAKLGVRNRSAAIAQLASSGQLGALLAAAA